jgi:predicted RNA-binding Zn ribbon-like protein
MDMMTAARAMGNTDVLARLAPGQTYSPVDSAVRYLKHWTAPLKNKDGSLVMIEGEPVTEMWLRYKTESVSGQCEIDERLEAIMDVGENDDPDHLATNILKARRETLLAQMKQAADNTAGTMPHDHQPLRQWGALPEPVVACLEANGIHSVQQLRDARESKLHQLPQGLNPTRMREMARAYIDSKATANAGAVIGDYEARIKGQEDKINKLTALLEQLIEQKADEAIGEDAPKRRGRPPRIAEPTPEAVSADAA